MTEKQKIYWSSMKGKKSNSWKGGKPKCFCGKQISYDAKNCSKHKVVSLESQVKRSISMKGKNTWMIGKSPSEKTREKLRIAQLKRVAEGRHNNYKGENVGYRALHHWVRRHLGKAKRCSFCDKEGVDRQIHWANISQEYKRDLTDWMQLCALHHRQYDVGKIAPVHH